MSPARRRAAWTQLPRATDRVIHLYAKGQSADGARVHLTGLLQFLSVAADDQTAIEQPLNLACQDFEDAVQMMAAVRAGADYLPTRNIQDYRVGPLPVLGPAELLALIRS